MLWHWGGWEGEEEVYYFVFWARGGIHLFWVWGVSIYVYIQNEKTRPPRPPKVKSLGPGLGVNCTIAS